MKNRILSTVAVATLFTASMMAMGQSTNGPTSAAAASSSPAVPSALTAPTTPNEPGRYTGPSSTALTTVKQLVDSGKDGQYARLQGKIVSHDREKNYTFADDSGRMPVEISSKRFPQGQSISAEQRVELSGKLDKEWRKTEFEVKEIKLLP